MCVDFVPQSFDHAWLVLIPKAPIAFETAHVASLANLGLWTLGNSSYKIMAKVLYAPLEMIARLDAHSDLGLVFLDTQAAFPSIDWGSGWCTELACSSGQSCASVASRLVPRQPGVVSRGWLKRWLFSLLLSSSPSAP